MATISELVVKITGDASGLSKATSDAEKQLKGLGFSFDELKNLIGPAVLGAALVGAGKAFADYIDGISDAAEEINTASEKTGIAVDQLQALKFAAEQSDVSFGTLTQSVSLMTRGLETNAATFASLGVELKDVDGTMRNAGDIFRETLGTLADMEDETARNQLAMKLFGRSAAELTPLLNEGSDGIRELTERAEDLGVIMSEELVSSAEEFGDNMEQLKGATTALGYGMAEDLLPSINKLVSGMASFIGEIVKGRASIKEFQEVLQGGVKDGQDFEAAIRGADSELKRLEEAKVRARSASQRGGYIYDPAQFDAEIERAKQLRRELVEQYRGQQRNIGGTVQAKEASEQRAVASDKEAEVIVAAIEAENSARSASLDTMRDIAKLQESYAKDEAERIEERAKNEKEFTERLEQEGRDRYDFEMDWLEKAGTDKMTVLGHQYADAIAEADRLGADKKAIEEWYAAESVRITEEQIAAQKTPYDELFETISEGFADILQNTYLDSMREIGEAFKDSGDGLEAMAAGIKEVWEAIVDALPELLLQAGLQILPTNAPIGLALIAASGLVALGDASGFFDGVGDFFGDIGDGIADFFGFAGGTDFAPGGQAVVGENGPEIVNLPRGAEVIPNHSIDRASGASVNIVINSPREVSLYEAKRIFDMTARNLAFEGVL
jgi:hypothetical protein